MPIVTKYFSNTDLRKLIVPLFVEQFLLMFVGIADTFTVSFSSEADVSGVSLVTSFNTILIFLFTALSSGGAVIISQYIGNKDLKKASQSASQLLTISILISFVLTILIVCFQTPLLHVLFGKIDANVMQACQSYLFITTLSLPGLAIYDAGAALCRCIGKTNVTMYVSTLCNVLNVVGNCIGVFVLHLGAAGVAYPSLISRWISAVLITLYCFQKGLKVHYHMPYICTWINDLQKRMMGIAIPNGIENGVHQLVKVALSSMVALFGTYQIAANGVAQSIWSLASIIGLAMAPVYTTVIGQCMGARDIDAANYYFKKLDKLTFILSIAWNILIFLITPMIVKYSAISQQAKDLVIWLVLINNIFNGLFYPFAGSLGNGLRAAGDVKFTMIVSISLTIVARLLFSAILGLWFNWKVIGVAIGMSMDLVFRGIIFIARLKSQKWTEFELI